MAGVDRRFFAVVVLISALFVACDRGGNGGDPNGTSRPGGPAPSVSGQFELEGAIVQSGSYEVDYGFASQDVHTCETVASAESYVVPTPVLTDERRFNWTARLAPYDGPGRYDLDDLKELAVDVRKEADDDPVRYASGEGTTAALVIREDNSGTFDFAGLLHGEEVLSGSLTWSCEDPEEAE